MSRLSNTAVFAALALAPVVGATPVQKKKVSLDALSKGQKALSVGQAAEALRQANLFLAKNPKRWEGYGLAGTAEILLDEPDKAETALRRALTLAPASAKLGLQSSLAESAALRQAIGFLTFSKSLTASGNKAGAARAEESAYHAFPSRYAYGLKAANLYESADLFQDSVRLLKVVDGRKLPASVSQQIRARLTSLEAKIEEGRQQSAAELARKEAADRKAEEERLAEADRVAKENEAKAREADRLAKKKERDRIEAERKAEEDRQKAEKERLDREETDRLNRILSDQRSVVSDSESVVRRAEGSMSDAEREVSDADGKADRARSRRDHAKREKEEWEDKVNDAKTDVARDLARGELRSAEGRYNDAKGDYESANRKYEDAKSRLDQAKRDVDSARRNLDQARQNVRDTEAAISRITSG